MLNDGTAVGTETTATPPLDTDAPASATVTGGFTLADLTWDRLGVRVSASRGAGEGAQGASLQVVGVTVNYTSAGAALQLVRVTVNFTPPTGPRRRSTTPTATCCPTAATATAATPTTRSAD